MILSTRRLQLLANVDAAWVHYKLDLGIDHVLVDEAQDTSHKQWEIVRRLTAEFTAGAGARGVGARCLRSATKSSRSIRFRMLRPKEFAEMRALFQKRAREKRSRNSSSANSSIRSAPARAILAAVDEVFKRQDVAQSVTSDAGGFPPHIALPDTPPGLVEIWEPEKPDEREEIEGWDAPFDTVSETSPRVKLARRIARSMCAKMVDERRRRVTAIFWSWCASAANCSRRSSGRSRTRGVEVAGADRLMLTEHIAVMDLMALAEALLLPQDDLALATVLRSPLFGFSDDDLFEIACDRGRTSLRTVLKRKASEKEAFADAAAQLDELAEAARRETPFAFYALLLGEGGGAAAFSRAAWRRRLTMRSTSFSIWRSNTSGARRRRCRAF